MDAAEAYFLELGYMGTSMEAVAQAAQVSKLTIYSHFGDKETLFKSVIERKCEQHSMSQGYLHLANFALPKALKVIALNYVNLILSDEAIKLHRIISAESTRDSKSAQLYYEAGPTRLKNDFCDLLEIWRAEKKIKVLNCSLACDQFFSLIKGEMHARALMGVGRKPTGGMIEKHVADSIDVFLNTYA